MKKSFGWLNSSSGSEEMHNSGTIHVLLQDSTKNKKLLWNGCMHGCTLQSTIIDKICLKTSSLPPAQNVKSENEDGRAEYL